MKGFYTGRTIWRRNTPQGMIRLTNGRGVTLRTAWVEDSDEGPDNQYRTDNEPKDLSCPSCGAPLRKKMSGKAFCWFCEKEFELDISGSIVFNEEEEDGEEDDFEMDLRISREDADEDEDEEMEFDIEIDVDEEEYEGEEGEDIDFEMDEDEIEEEEDIDFDIEEDEPEEDEELEWDEEEMETEMEEDDGSFIEEADSSVERKRKRRLGSTDVEFD
jgi:hypothetical protein